MAVEVYTQHSNNLASCSNTRTAMSALKLPWIYFNFPSSCSQHKTILQLATKVPNCSAELTNVLSRCGDWDSVSLLEPRPHADREVSRTTAHPDYNPANLHR